jgi:predicted Zn finger-like uncharacterized protein
MKIVCDACGAKYSIADEKVAGKVFKIRCKKCSNIIVVRGNAGEQAAAAPAEEAPPNKDTKVFDYAGYDSPQEAMAAAADGEWHLVIDQEQVGPMTAAEVRQRFAAGEVDAESYIWKEGFGDWERIPDVPEFADLEGGAAPAADGGLFGGVDAADAAGQSNPSDLFGGDAGGGGGADLFGDAGASGGSDLFGGGGSVGENTGEVEMGADAEAQLKGQRNENSVLFSLGNLAALASDSPKPAASAPISSGGGGGGGISNTGGTEGSGLIDIRSMASVYLADKKPAGVGAMPAGSADDLPVFSQSAFESASPVLLPTHGGGTDKKLLYTLIGVIAALGLAAVILVVIVLKGGDEDKTEPVAAADVAEGDSDEAGADTETDPGSDTDPVGDDTDTEDPAKVATDDPPTTAEPATAIPTAATKTPKTPTNTKTPKNPKTPRVREPKPPKPPKEPVEAKGGSCDEVTCLVDPGKACCKKYNKGGSTSSSSSSSSKNSSLPEKPTRGDITSGIGKVRGRVNSCGDKHGGSGTVKVKMKIGGSGKVQSAQASGGGSALRSCVVSAVKRAKFKKTQKGMTVTYPFVFR